MSSLPIDVIRSEQIKSAYTNTTPGMVATWLAVTVLTIGLVYIDVAVKTRATIFLIVMFGHTAARVVLFRAYARIAPPVQDWRKWALWFTIGTFVGGITIGTGAIWMMSADRLDLQLIVFLLIFAVASGAVSAFAAYLPAFYFFFVAISLVPGVWLFTRGDVLHLTIGLLFIIWIAAVAEQARRTSQSFIGTIYLRFENVDLVASLRREKAFAEEANAAKSRFLAAASHDLRQPVHALSLFVAAARAHPMNDETRGLLDHIDGSVRSMSQLFGGLLDISRLDAGVVEVNRVPFVIGPLIDRVCRDYANEAEAKGVRLEVVPATAIVKSDPLLLERVLRNLIGNAIAYTDAGKVAITCTAQDRLSLRVSDTGRGIPAHEHEHIFQEFYQLGNPERDRTKGVGLGLAIVKRLTALLEHRLTVESEVGKGSTFTLEIPLAPAGANVVSTESDPSSIEGLQASGLILVVDDEIAIQAAMKSILQSWGYEAIVAATCDEMLKRIATHREVPKLIICDYRLRQEENGIAVIERLRSEYNDDIPGMLITGDTAPDRLREAQDSGFLLLHKPVPNAKLRAAITHLIQPDQVTS
jgi:signal transduction histidine kinase/CheY-like chemotaxis protein